MFGEFDPLVLDARRPATAVPSACSYGVEVLIDDEWQPLSRPGSSVQAKFVTIESATAAAIIVWEKKGLPARPFRNVAVD